MKEDSQKDMSMKDESMMKILDDILELRETIFTVWVPEVAQQHFRSSQRETILGVRTVLDHVLERLDKRIEVRDKPESKQSSRSIEISD